MEDLESDLEGCSDEEIETDPSLSYIAEHLATDPVSACVLDTYVNEKFGKKVKIVSFMHFYYISTDITKHAS